MERHPDSVPLTEATCRVTGRPGETQGWRHSGVMCSPVTFCWLQGIKNWWHQRIGTRRRPRSLRNGLLAILVPLHHNSPAHGVLASLGIGHCLRWGRLNVRLCPPWLKRGNRFYCDLASS